MDKLLSVGKILNFHGTMGEMKVGYTQGKEQQLCEVDEFFVEKDNKLIKLTPESVRFHKNTALMKFEEINSLTEVVELKGCFIKADKEFLEQYLEEDEFYIDDLAGLDVVDKEGNTVGKVDFVVTKEQEDLLLIKNEAGEEFFIPFVKKLVPEVSLKEKRIVINNIPGLLENAEV